MKALQRASFGGSPEETPEAHRTASPITYAAQVSAPILVMQAKNDSRCPPRQMSYYEQIMRELGKQIEVYWFDAGHGSLANEERIHHQKLMMQFAQKVLNS